MGGRDAPPSVLKKLNKDYDAELLVVEETAVTMMGQRGIEYNSFLELIASILCFNGISGYFGDL